MVASMHVLGMYIILVCMCIMFVCVCMHNGCAYVHDASMHIIILCRFLCGVLICLLGFFPTPINLMLLLYLSCYGIVVTT